MGAVLTAQLATAASCASSYLTDGTRTALAARYTFAATAGDTVRILMESGVLDSVLYLVGPNGNLVAQDDNSGAAGNAAIPNLTGHFALPETGIYTIEATSYTAGAFTLRLSGSARAVSTLWPAAVNLPNTAGDGTLSFSISPGSVSPGSLNWGVVAASAGDWLQVATSGGAGSRLVEYTYRRPGIPVLCSASGTRPALPVWMWSTY
ncbi:MAG: PPC domain-containing protein [Acidobacteriota bacterium]|jgi:hypothetical protein